MGERKTLYCSNISCPAPKIIFKKGQRPLAWKFRNRPRKSYCPICKERVMAEEGLLGLSADELYKHMRNISDPDFPTGEQLELF